MDELLKEIETLNATSALRNDYAKTLALLRSLKAGNVTIDHVTMTADGWQVSALVVEAVPTEEPIAAEPVAEPAAD